MNVAEYSGPSVVTRSVTDGDAGYAGLDEKEKEKLIEKENIEDEEILWWYSTKRAARVEGNIYRLWALGMSKGTRQTILTGTVVMVQVVGAFMMFNYIGRSYHGKVSIPFSCSSDFEIEAQENMWDHILLWFDFWLGTGGVKSETSRAIQIKILGFLLMFILFFSTDQDLLKQDLETDGMRRSFGRLMHSWRATIFMKMDSIVNNLTVLIILSSSLGLFLLSEDVKDMCLDAFGLIFLMRLDDLSGDVNWGLDEGDFEQVVEEFDKITDEKLKIERRKQETVFQNRSQYKSFVQEQLDKLTRETSWSRLSHGDSFFSLGRACCFFSLLCVLPAFVTLTFVDEATAAESKCEFLSHDGEGMPLFNTSFKAQILFQWRVWAPWSIAMYVLWSAALIYEFMSSSEFAQVSQDFQVPADPDLFVLYKRDWTGFMYMVLCRRPDARLEVARSVQRRLFPYRLCGDTEGWPLTPLEKEFAKEAEEKAQRRYGKKIKIEYDACEGGIFNQPPKFNPRNLGDSLVVDEDDDDDEEYSTWTQCGIDDVESE